MKTRYTVEMFASFTEAEARDREEEACMTPEERLELVQILREQHPNITEESNRETGERLRRVARVVQRA